MESTGTGQDLQLTVGGLPATARWVPLAEGRAEILLTLPASTPLGCYVPVQIRYRQGLTGNTVTLPVAAPGLPCENKTLWPPSTTASKEPIGLLLLTRTNLLIELPGQSGVRIVDEEAALHFFTPVTSAQAPPVESLPPPGTCVTYHGLYQPEFSLGKNLLQMLQGRLPGALRDAGRSIALQGPSGKATIPDEDGYFALIGGERPDYGRAARPLFLASGEYVARALGGAQVGPFEAAFRMPQALEGRNFSSLGTIDRGRGAVVAWHGGARESATYIIAVSVRHSTTAFGVAFCAVRAGLREFRLPPEALANLPETEQDTTMPLNLIFVLSMPAPTNFQAKGLREGFIVPITVAGRNVNFR